MMTEALTTLNIILVFCTKVVFIAGIVRNGYLAAYHDVSEIRCMLSIAAIALAWAACVLTWSGF